MKEIVIHIAIDILILRFFWWGAYKHIIAGIVNAIDEAKSAEIIHNQGQGEKR